MALAGYLKHSPSLTSLPQKSTTAALKPAFPISTRDVCSKVGAARYPVATAEKSPEVEEMEIVTSQLSMKLCIEDIDVADGDNPQLCAEYVKEIYEYMMMLEVITRWENNKRTIMYEQPATQCNYTGSSPMLI